MLEVNALLESRLYRLRQRSNRRPRILTVANQSTRVHLSLRPQLERLVACHSSVAVHKEYRQYIALVARI